MSLNPAPGALCGGCRALRLRLFVSDVLVMLLGHIFHTKPGKDHGTCPEQAALCGQVLHTAWCRVRVSISDCKQPLKTSWKAFGKSRPYIMPNYHPWQTSLSTGLFSRDLVFHVPGANGDLENLLMKVKLTQQDHRNDKFVLFCRN